jgi:hypothetical protein
MKEGERGSAAGRSGEAEGGEESEEFLPPLSISKNLISIFHVLLKTQPVSRKPLISLGIA